MISIIQSRQQPDHIVDAFVDSLKNLESLDLSSDVDFFTNAIELLHRLALRCKIIKHLKLYKFYRDGNQLI